MLAQGLLLMVAGTGTVFAFLIVMVLVMMAVGKYYKIHEARFLAVEAPRPPRKQNRDDMHSIVAAIAVSLQHS